MAQRVELAAGGETLHASTEALINHVTDRTVQCTVDNKTSFSGQITIPLF
jgi:hypothetical protein